MDGVTTMSNQFINTQLLANTALAMFANNSPYVMTGSRMYQSDFQNSGYKIGDTLQVRRQNNFIIGDGSTAVPQDIIETVENITVAHQYHALVTYTIQDLSLRIEDFSRMFLQPAIQNIISKIVRHIAGNGPTLHPGDTLTVNGAVSSGNTFVLARATASVTNYFLPGDLISIAGVHSTNPLSRASTGQDMQFVVTQAANSSGGGAITLQINPTIISTSSSPLQNVDNAVPNGAAVTVVPSYNVNVAYPQRALDIVCP